MQICPAIATFNILANILRMKKLSYCLFLLFFSASAYAETQINETAKVASLCKVWGFLKYYHPDVANGKYDWDKELFRNIGAVCAAKSKEELSAVYIAWINSLNPVKERRKPRKPVTDSLMLNFDTRWMDDKDQFTDSLSALLHHIERNKRGSRKSYYAKNTVSTSNTPVLRNEEAYTDSVYPSANLRLLCLFRYWNAINYYFPCKYACDEKWDVVLEQMIPKFLKARYPDEYADALFELTAKTNDSHSELWTPRLPMMDGPTIPPFRYAIVNGKVIVTSVLNDTLARLNDIKYGDIIIAANGKPCQDIINDKLKLAGGSNMAAKLYRLEYQLWLFCQRGSSMELSVERDGDTSTRRINKYFGWQLAHYFAAKHDTMSVKIFDDTIGYFNLDVLRPRDVRATMKQVQNTKALVLDVRNYPKNVATKLARHLNNRRKPFVKFCTSDPRYPGIDKYDYIQKCGLNRRNYYKGRVIVLFNERSQSKSEYSVMIFKTAPRVTCIGSQSAGANGATTALVLPGGYKTRFSNCSVFYPNGESLVRKGLTPDIEVRPTIEGIKQHRDEVLERALEYARTNK